MIRIIELSLIEYLDCIKLEKNGVIVIKIIALNFDTFNYSITHIYDNKGLIRTVPYDYYIEINNRLILIKNDSHESLIFNDLKLNDYNSDVRIKYKDLFLSEESILRRDTWLDAIVIFNRNLIRIDILPNYKIPAEYQIYRKY